MNRLIILTIASLLCMAIAEKVEPATIIGVNGNCGALVLGVSFFDQSNAQTANKVYLDIYGDMSKFECSSNASQKLTIVFGNNTGYNKEQINDMTLEFKLTPNTLYWELSKAYISLGEEKNNTVPLIYMGAPYGMETPAHFSFACTQTVFLLNPPTQKGPSPRINFYIEHFQVQPWNLVEVNSTDYLFGNVNYCQGFFSSGIWMAISASLILTFILAFGVSLLFNVRPLDRFDDPKGKPLNIGAEK